MRFETRSMRGTSKYLGLSLYHLFALLLTFLDSKAVIRPYVCSYH